MQGEEKKSKLCTALFSGLLAVISRAYPRFLSPAPRNILYVYNYVSSMPIDACRCLHVLTCRHTCMHTCACFLLCLCVCVCVCVWSVCVRACVCLCDTVCVCVLCVCLKILHYMKHHNHAYSIVMLTPLGSVGSRFSASLFRSWHRKPFKPYL